MRTALEEAKLAFDHDEVPIGAILVHKDTGDIVSRASNKTIEMSDPTAHAEILCVRQLCKTLKVQRIPDYNLYVTLEPCPMCAAALSYARLNKIIFGASDLKSGGLTSDIALYEYPQIHHKPDLVSGILEEECRTLLQKFFQQKR